MEARLAKIRAKELAQKQKYLKGDQNFKKRRIDVQGIDNGGEEQFVLDDYDSEGDEKSNQSQTGGLYSAETLALMEKLGMTTKPKEEDFEDDNDEMKVTVFESSANIV
jgi:chromosome transmission fidelity protein 1